MAGLRERILPIIWNKKRPTNNSKGKKKIAEKPPRNSVGFYGDQGLSWAVEPRKEDR
jgi:hypothetical protein